MHTRATGRSLTTSRDNTTITGPTGPFPDNYNPFLPTTARPTSTMTTLSLTDKRRVINKRGTIVTMSDAEVVLNTIGALRGLFNNVEENKDQCQYLIRRCIALEKPIQSLLKNEERLQFCKEALQTLKMVLDDCYRFCKKYAGKQWVVKAVRHMYKDDQERFAELNSRLTASSSDLQVALTADTINDGARSHDGQKLTSEIQDLKAQVSELTAMLGGLLKERGNNAAETRAVMPPITTIGSGESLATVTASTSSECESVFPAVPVSSPNFSPTAMAVHAGLKTRPSTRAPERINLHLLQYVADDSSLLGYGTFAKVYRGIYAGQPCAIKVCVRGGSSERPSLSAESRLSHEARILQMASGSPNVIACHGVCVERGILLMEIATCTLHDLLYGIGGMLAPASMSCIAPDIHDIAIKLSILIDVANALAYLHHHGILHRGLHPRHILLVPSAPCKGDGGAAPGVGITAKLGGFGLASAMAINYALPEVVDSPDRASGVALGTAAYSAPELFDGFGEDPPYSAASDMYAFGVVCNEVLTEVSPWQGLTEVQVLHQVMALKARPQLWEGESPVGNHLLLTVIGNSEAACLHQDPVQRPPAATVYEEIRTCVRELRPQQSVGKAVSAEAASCPTPCALPTAVVGDLTYREGCLIDLQSPHTDQEEISPRTDKCVNSPPAPPLPAPELTPPSALPALPSVPPPALPMKPTKPPKPLSVKYAGSEVGLAVLALLDKVASTTGNRADLLQELGFLVQRNSEAQECLLEARGVPKLVAIVREGQGQEVPVAVTVLGYCAEGNAKLQAAICDTEVLGDLRKILFGYDAELKDCTAATAMYLMIDNPTTQEMAAAAGVVAALVPVIAHSKHSEEGILADLRFLMTLAQEHSDHAALLALLKHAPSELQQQAVAHIQLLLKGADAARHKDGFGQAGAVAVLLSLLRDEVEEPLLMDAVKVLKALSHRHDGNRADIVLQCGIPVLVRVLDNPAAEVRLPVLQTLHGIASYSPAYSTAVELTKVAALLRMLTESEAMNAQVKTQADMLLTELARRRSPAPSEKTPL